MSKIEEYFENVKTDAPAKGNADQGAAGDAPKKKKKIIMLIFQVLLILL